MLLLASCTDTPSPGTPVTVFAAASLRQAFLAEGQAFEATHPGVRVRFSFAGSQVLVAQVKQGAPADVVATADPQSMSSLGDRVLGQPQVLAHNRLAILTATGNPRHIRGLADLPRVRVVLAGPTVPLGKASALALARAGVTVRPRSLEDSATGVITKLRLGEADAGIGYVTDLAGTGLAGLPLPGTTTTLMIGALTASPRAGDFVDFVLSAEGRRILLSFGFR